MKIFVFLIRRLQVQANRFICPTLVETVQFDVHRVPYVASLSNFEDHRYLSQTKSLRVLFKSFPTLRYFTTPTNISLNGTISDWNILSHVQITPTYRSCGGFRRRGFMGRRGVDKWDIRSCISVFRSELAIRSDHQQSGWLLRNRSLEQHRVQRDSIIRGN